MKRFAWTLIAGALVLQPAFADDAHHKPGAGASQDRAALSEGEVRKVDKDGQKITIKHGPLANLEMPAMTMVFRVTDVAMLDQVKPGDKVNFQADKVGGAFVLVKLEAAK